MATRKDLLKAHKFTSQRLVSALVDRNPDELQPPLRRVFTGTFVSVMISVLVLAGFGIVGLIFGGGSKDWQQDKTVIIDTSSGVVFAFLGTDLYPTTNITSAKLATGGGEVTSVKSSTLQGYPQQNRIGIPDAPAQLPVPEDVTPWPLRVCSTAPDEDDLRYTTLQVGVGPSPGEASTAVVRDSGGLHYLLADGRAYPVPDEGSGTPALLINLGFSEAGTPSDAMINAIPQGPPLVPLDIPGDGERAQVTPGGLADIGSLATVEGTVTSYYVLLSDGLSEITWLEHRVLEVSGRETTAISAAEAGGAISSTRIRQEDMPRGEPSAADSTPEQATTALCVTWGGVDSPAVVELGSPVPEVGAGSAEPGTADLVQTAPLGGALLRAENTSEDGASFLIYDGQQFGVPDAESRAALGYAETPSQPVSPALLKLVPRGLPADTSLSVEAARQPA